MSSIISIDKMRSRYYYIKVSVDTTNVRRSIMSDKIVVPRIDPERAPRASKPKSFYNKLIIGIVVLIIIIVAVVVVLTLMQDDSSKVQSLHVGDSKYLVNEKMGSFEDSKDNTYYWFSGSIKTLGEYEIAKNSGKSFTYIAIHFDADEKIDSIQCLKFNSRLVRELDTVTVNGKKQYAINEHIDFSNVSYRAIFKDRSFVEGYIGTGSVDTSSVGKRIVTFRDNVYEYSAYIDVVDGTSLDKEYSMITFELNGGLIGEATQSAQTIRTNDSLTSLPIPTKANFEFDGWYTDSDLTNKVESALVVTTNIQLFAKWKQSASISFVTNGGTEIPAMSVAVGGNVTAPNDPTRDGYRFDGWYLSGDFSGERYVFGKVTQQTTVLYAKWTKSVSITIDANNGTSVDVITGFVGDNLTFGQIPATPVKTGSEFLGWFLGTIDGEPFTFSETSTFPSQNITVVAKWKQQSSINFVTFVNTITIPSITKYDGEAITMPADPVRAGYVFMGWYTGVVNGTSPDFSKAKIFSATTMPSGGATVYAKWLQIKSISTYEQLLAIKDNLDGAYALSSNIEVTSDWTPLGSADKPFTGMLDGKGYKITGFKISAVDSTTLNVGLFAVNAGTIKNLEIQGKIDITTFSTANVGMFAGLNTGIITDCCFTSGNIYVTASKQSSVGAIAGTNTGKVANCYSVASITSKNTNTDVQAFIGGIVGFNDRGSSLTSCFVTGKVTAISSASTDFYVGKVVGANNNGTVTKCYYDESTFVLDVTEVIKKTTNTDATPAAHANLHNNPATTPSWITTNLGWSTSIWNFTSNSTPALRAGVAG